MNTVKTYALFIDGQEAVEYGSKKTAVKYGDESGKDYLVRSPSGQIVHEVQVELTDLEKEADRVAAEARENIIADVPTPTVPEPVADLKHVETRDFPGNYSIVMIPFVQDIAEAWGGIVVREERFAGKLVRRAHVSSDNTATLDQFLKSLDRILAEVQPALHAWQKENVERRRSLTDMQKFLEHREFIAMYGKQVAQDLTNGRR